ncbi:MAG: Ig-like domain-containing protein [Bacteroidales bacterium]|nr:Ig-like domain-containing protein [Bacteroidales bacterium]
MGKLFNIVITFSAVLLMAGLTASCGPKEDPEVAVASVSLSQSSVALDPGGSVNLTATVSPSNATNKTVTWSSSNQSVATVNNGTVTAVGAGSATITATAGGKTATCNVSVNKKVIGVESVELDKSQAEVEAGSSINLKATVKPSDATDQNVTWESDNPGIATVDGSGKVLAVKEGVANITAKAGGKTVVCQVTVKPNEEDRIKTALMKIYDAMDGQNWVITQKWDTSNELNSWQGVTWNKTTHELKLTFNGDFGLKGEFPDCFDELTSCVRFWVQNEPGVTGTLPPSFSKLNRLGLLVIGRTSMTSLPDLFGGMPLWYVGIGGNESMSGPLPESLGESDDLMGEESIDGIRYPQLDIDGNAFTGSLPDSWARLGLHLRVRLEPHISEIIPESYLTAEERGYFIYMYALNSRFSDNPCVLGDYDIPAFWPKNGFNDLVTGQEIPFKSIVSKNKATVIINWATWCPFSKQLLPLLERMYDKYHDDGLEIIATQELSVEERTSGKPYEEFVLERGYDKWYNISYHDTRPLAMTHFEYFTGDGMTPSMVVVDNKGNIMFSCLESEHLSDPSRNRFGYPAATRLIPVLEELFGPLEGDDDYSSTDFSKDGEVMTLQKATVGKGINVVFLGDAYTDKDMDKNGLFEKMMNRSMEEFFAIEPYKTFRNRFNVYAVKAVSEHGRPDSGHNTAFGTLVTSNSITSGKIDKCYEYALKVPGIKGKDNLMIGVLVNSSYSRGITVMSESLQSGVAFYSSCANNSELFGSTLRHEAGGHAFAFLADEYSVESGSPSKDDIDEFNRVYEQYGWYSNIDFTDDPKKVKWNMFLSDERYKDEVGIYEGGGRYYKGVYRPSENSMMHQEMEYYNAPSRWAIYKRIMELSGETASFDNFLEYDAVNRGKKQSSAPRTRSAAKWEPDAPPVVTP